jgi:hypothetical protein
MSGASNFPNGFLLHRRGRENVEIGKTPNAYDSDPHIPERLRRGAERRLKASVLSHAQPPL